MYSSTVAGSLMAHLFNAAYMTIVIIVWLSAKDFYRSRIVNTLFLIALWTSFEWLHQHWELAWPWFNLGHAFGSVPNWVQWYSLTGSFGGTVWILLVNCLVFYAIQDFTRARQARTIGLLLLLTAVIVLPLYLSHTLLHADEKGGQTIKVLVVQPNIHPKAEKFAGVPVRQQIEKAISIARVNDSSLPQLVIFPETMLVDPIELNNIQVDSAVMQLRKGLKSFENAAIITGAFTRISNNWPAADEHALIHDSVAFVLYNSLLLIQDNSVQVYHKTKLVPLVEKLPFLKLMLPFRRMIEEQGGFFGTYGTHNVSSTLHINDSVAIVPLICFESAFEGYQLPKIANRPVSSLMVLITNDGWWNSSGGYLQHLQLARLRAIESGQWIVRCANTGVSAIISPRGIIVESADYNTAGAISFDVPLIDQQGMYSRIHPYPSLIMVTIAGLMLSFLLFTKVKKRYS